MELQEKIDQYLLDQLNPANKIKFEQLIAGDSALKSEVVLQQSVVSALGHTKSLQLKSRLQKIPVSMASTGNALRMKWLGAAAVGTIAAGLIIFLFAGQENTTTSFDNSSTPQTTTTENITNSVPSNESAIVSAKENQSTTPEQQSIKEKQTSTAKASVKSIELKAFDNSANFEETENGNLSTANVDNSSVPENTLYTETNNKLSNLSVNVDTSNPKDKSYQFTGSKLTLFGDFNNKPYELLELNNKGQKNLFLSYNNEYYELVWGQMKKTPLKKVLHKETLEKLKVINP